MKAQMRFQKYICLVMLIVGALGLLYAFFYSSGAVADLGQNLISRGGKKVSAFTAASGKYDAELYNEISLFNNVLMICGILMILFAVALYVTACHKRRNYYISNYIATGICAGGNIVVSLVLMIMNVIYRGKFLNVDFTAWKTRYDYLISQDSAAYYSDSTVWFDVGFAVYALIIIASAVLVLNLIWKIKLMQGEKQLLESSRMLGGETV